MNNLKDIAIIYHPNFLLHTNAQHPECKERLESIMSRLEKSELAGRCSFYTPFSLDVEAVATVHSLDHIRSVESACRRGLPFIDTDTYLCPETYEVALLAAGAGIKALDLVMDGEVDYAFVMGRPPGHHAEPWRSMGFCIFNNIAIAARIAARKYSLERILIVDWDVHHGNGTQTVFEEEDTVLYFSIHQSPAYPGSGSAKEVGRGAGRGYTINVPLPPGCCDEDYFAVFEEVLLPVACEYKPQLLLISAGQDAHYADPLAGMNLTGKGYYEMTLMLKNVAREYAGGKMAFFLEGGYHLEGQADAVFQIISALGDRIAINRKKLPASFKREQDRRCAEQVKMVINEQSAYWSSLR